MKYLGKEFNEVVSIPEEMHQEFLTKGAKLLTDCGHENSRYGLETIWNEWKANKGWLWNLLSGSPYWNGKGQIVISFDFHRVIDRQLVNMFFDWARNYAFKNMKKEKVGFFEFREVTRAINKVEDKIYYLDCLRRYMPFAMEKEYRLFHEHYEHLKSVLERFKGANMCGDMYEQDSYKKYFSFSQLVDYVARAEELSKFATEEDANKVNELFPTVHAVAGQKFSRIVNKVCGIVGIDKASEYRQKFSEFGDAMNPLVVKRHTVISINPIDYWTMSFGNSWNSCHDIDIEGRTHDDVSGYSGCYCSGTESYMLDSSSIVFYTVDASYNGNEFEFQPKITRNMFHLGKDKLVQGRLYPICESAGAKEAMTEVREVVQRLICEAAGVTNFWHTLHGKSNCRNVVNSPGTHYRDYTSYPNCNVSYWKGNGDELNEERIDVGHDPICPNCGNEHKLEKRLLCNVCAEEGFYCASCGSYVEYDNAICVDGEYYCRDCVSWCEYHQEYETGEMTYIRNYGDVCEGALESGYFVEIEDPGYWDDNNLRYIDDVYTTEDDHYYRNSDNIPYVTEDGYYYHLPDNMLADGYDENGNHVHNNNDDEEVA